jgi:hypothetical protein
VAASAASPTIAAERGFSCSTLSSKWNPVNNRFGQRTQLVGVLAVQVETAKGARKPEPRMTPRELVSDALDALAAGANDEVVAGAQSRQVRQQFVADPKSASGHDADAGASTVVTSISVKKGKK